MYELKRAFILGAKTSWINLRNNLFRPIHNIRVVFGHETDEKVDRLVNAAVKKYEQDNPKPKP